MPAAPKTSNVVSIRVVNFSKTIFKFLARFSMITLGKSKVICSWHVFTVSMLEVLNSFNIFIRHQSATYAEKREPECGPMPNAMASLVI